MAYVTSNSLKYVWNSSGLIKHQFFLSLFLYPFANEISMNSVINKPAPGRMSYYSFGAQTSKDELIQFNWISILSTLSHFFHISVSADNVSISRKGPSAELKNNQIRFTWNGPKEAYSIRILNKRVVATTCFRLIHRSSKGSRFIHSMKDFQTHYTIRAWTKHITLDWNTIRPLPIDKINSHQLSGKNWRRWSLFRSDL